MPSRIYRTFVNDAYVSLTVFCWSAITIITINDNVCTFGAINGKSMMPTLSPNFATTQEKDRVLWRMWRSRSGIQRGDVLRFMSPEHPDVFAAKRVIALEGDTVILDPCRRPKRKNDPNPPEARSWDARRGSAKVPAGHLWVEGDNWRETRDSNWYGPVSKHMVTGKAVSVVWPLERFWTKPWRETTTKTKVIEGNGVGDWTKEKLPIELAEVGDLGLPKG